MADRTKWNDKAIDKLEEQLLAEIATTGRLLDHVDQLDDRLDDLEKPSAPPAPTPARDGLSLAQLDWKTVALLLTPVAALIGTIVTVLAGGK